MRLGTIRTDEATTAVRIDGEDVVELPFPDVGGLLREKEWRSLALESSGIVRPLSDIAPGMWAPPVLEPRKIICVGLNYAQHITEMGRELPDFPTLFPKYAGSLIGPFDDLVVPAHASAAVDWEGELALVIGHDVRDASPDDAREAIAGYSVMNDVTMRDFQYRTTQWMQGKTFEGSTPFGPWIVTADSFDPDAQLETRVDGELKQSARTGDLVFSPAHLVSYVSQIITLQPGDVIATGTPGGVGHAREPREYLANGSILETSIRGIGDMRNRVVMIDSARN